MRTTEATDAQKSKAAASGSSGGDGRQITITSTNPNLSVTAWMGQDPPNVTAGYGGWETVARPKRQALTVWRGHEPYQMDLPLLLEGWPIASVESRISALERMARPPKPLDEPPIVRLDGYVPHSDLAWVVQRITWGETIRGENGQRVRQFLTLGLIKYIEEDRVQQGNARVTAQANASVKGGGKKPHIVKEGETMRGIAQKELGNSDRYQEIMKLNNIRDPKSIKVNQSLRLP